MGPRPLCRRAARIKQRAKEIIGPAEMQRRAQMRYFTPHKSPLDAELRRYSERPPELQPAIDAVEAFLLAVFLRRYVTYCAQTPQVCRDEWGGAVVC